MTSGRCVPPLYGALWTKTSPSENAPPLERMMACGLGTCQSCVVRVRDDAAEEGWRYVLACVDGPVFDGDQMVW